MDLAFCTPAAVHDHRSQSPLAGSQFAQWSRGAPGTLARRSARPTRAAVCPGSPALPHTTIRKPASAGHLRLHVRRWQENLAESCQVGIGEPEPIAGMASSASGLTGANSTLHPSSDQVTAQIQPLRYPWMRASTRLIHFGRRARWGVGSPALPGIDWVIVEPSSTPNGRPAIRAIRNLHHHRGYRTKGTIHPGRRLGRPQNVAQRFKGRRRMTA